MKASKKELAEILGIFAVVASLIFVGMQLQLDRKVALADQYFNRAETVKADRRSALESEAYMQYVEESWPLGWRPVYWDEDWDVAKQVEGGLLSARSVVAEILTLRLDIVGYDNLYFQYQQGLLDEGAWNHHRSTLKRAMFEDELVRAVYQHYARSTIQPVLEEISREIESKEQKAEQDN